MLKLGWLYLGYWVGRYIFRRKAIHGYELIKRLRELGAL